jgi:hypothetical protein
MDAMGAARGNGNDVGRPLSAGDRAGGLPWAAVAFLLLSVVLSLSWSHVHLLWSDEFAALHTQNVASARILLHLQRTAPVSFEPPVYDLLGHAAIKVFGPGAFAIRLPALCGFVLMQVCLFRFVRRTAGQSAGVVAIGVTMMFWSFQYAVQARPYGTLLGWCGLAMLSWQTAVREEEETGHSAWRPIFLLALAIGLAINTHYYGILLLVPLCAAELARGVRRRRIDWRIGVAIGLGAASVITVLPFMKAASAFRAHFFSPVRPSYHFITNAYPWMMFGFTAMSVRAQRLLILGCGLLLVLLVVQFARRYRASSLRPAMAEVVFLLVLAGLPLAGFVLSRVLVIVVEGRYILPAMIGVAALLGILMGPLMGSPRTSRLVLGAVFVAVTVVGLVRIRAERRLSELTLSGMGLEPATMAIVEANPGKPIYVFNPAVFDLVSYYAVNPDMRSRMRLTYSSRDELEVDQSDYASLTVANLASFVPGKVVPYETLMGEPGNKLFLTYDSSADWTNEALARKGDVERLGPGFIGTELVAVEPSRGPR